MLARSHEWIVDSGSSYDLVGESALTDEDKGKLQKGNNLVFARPTAACVWIENYLSGSKGHGGGGKAPDTKRASEAPQCRGGQE